ncbi:MAG: FIST signal transduction protein [Microthrixaceae bacterium]
MATLRTGAALSEHPLATQAVGECVGQLLEAGGTGPDLLFVAVTPPLAGALEDVTAAARHLLEPGVLLACTSATLHGGAREVEDVGAMAMFAVWDLGGDVRPVRLAPGGAGARDDATLSGAAGTLLVVADPFSTSSATLLDGLAGRAPELTVVGGFTGPGRGAGGNLLTLDGAQHRDGAVGVLLGPGATVRSVVSQGTRPIGDPLTVTAAERDIVRTLGGAPALDRLREALEPLPPEDRATAARAVHLARVLDGAAASARDGEPVLVLPVRGADRTTGAIAVGTTDGGDPGDDVPVGATVQFHLRDPAAVDADLRRAVTGIRATGALLLTGTDRGSALFGTPDHDAAIVSEELEGGPLAGIGCAGELAPAAGRNRAYTGSAVVALFGAGRSGGAGE